MRKNYNRRSKLVAVSVIIIYSGLLYFSFALHNHSIGINAITSHSLGISNQDKNKPAINSMKTISQDQCVLCFACAFENNNKTSGLQTFTQTRSDYTSASYFHSQDFLPQSFFLKSLLIRAPPTATS